jgi:hypothetical protein
MVPIEMLGRTVMKFDAPRRTMPASLFSSHDTASVLLAM